MIPVGRKYNQFLAAPFNEKENARILICSSVTYGGFILVQTTWNSCRCSWGSLPCKLWKLCKRWIRLDFNSNMVLSAKVEKIMQSNCWYKFGAVNYLKIRLLTFSWSDSLEVALREFVNSTSELRLGDVAMDCSSLCFLVSFFTLCAIFSTSKSKINSSVQEEWGIN